MSSVEILVDEQPILVDGSGNLIDELKKHNIEIPHFCYHPELGIDGNCRMCLIEVKGQKRPQIACNTPISPGMEIYVNSELTRSVQRGNLELELINHPIDCPVCDQAGECDLQNYYMKFDLAKSKMKLENKVEKGKKFYYGCDVVHDQERCVLCTRCVRFTETITKTKELGIQKRGDESRIVIFPGRPIDNRYAGNIIEICPVGAMTSKDFRFKKRVWHLEPVKSICQGCSKGCAIYIDHYQEKYQEDKIYRIRSCRDDSVNGSFICDDGRFSYKKENEGRAKTVDYRLPLYQLKSRLSSNNGGKIFVSSMLSIEELFSINELAKHFNKEVISYSDLYIKHGDSDEYLIQEDKSPNRKSIEKLGIKEFDLVSQDLNVVFSLGEVPKELLKLLEKSETIFIGTHILENREVIACKSFSERSGHTINCDGIVREMKRAVVNNTLSIQEIIENLIEKKVEFNQDLIRGNNG